ncbi:MAG: cysteine desulfurase-like protein [Actinomycetota bacterium]|nr:cysteine desulfurase-like protein [Actinomycetota bacterium]
MGDPGTFDVEALRHHYPALADGRVWLDGAAGTQVPDAVIDAVTEVYRTGLGNQGAAFEVSQRLGELVTDARTAVADLVGAPDPDGVVFGPSMTALTYRFASVLARRWRPGDEIVVTELDHEANLWPWVQAARRVGVVVRTAPLDRLSGTLPAETVTGLLSDRTRLVAVTAASNLLGTMPEVPAITAAARGAGALSYVDGVHHCPHAVVDLPALGADVYLSSAYKWYGPHLAAAVTLPGLLAELEVDNLRPVRGPGPVRFELGTNPFPALAGVTAAVEHLAGQPGRAGRRTALVAARAAAVAHERKLGAELVDGLRGIDGVELLPGWDAQHRTPTASFRIRGAEPAEVAAALDRAGINVWHGHAYAWAAAAALGLGDTGGAVRASLNHYNRADDVQRLLHAVARCAAGTSQSR